MIHSDNLLEAVRSCSDERFLSELKRAVTNRKRVVRATRRHRELTVNCRLPGLFILMRERDISDRQLCELLKMSNNGRVTHWRTGRADPPLKMLKLMADVLVYGRGDEDEY